MRKGVIINMLGIFILYLGLSMIIPLLVAIYYGEEVYAFAFTLVVTILCGALMKFLTGAEYEISLRESFVFVSLTWLLASIFGALPYMFSGVIVNFVDAFFETMSGFSTTGATIFDSVEDLPRSILLWRSMTQWLGGMGIIALFVAIFPRIGVKGMQLLKAEVPGPVTEKMAPKVATTAKILWKIYVVLTLVQVILLLITGFSLFDAFAHAFTTMPTGGFSTNDLSITGFENPAAEVIIMAFMIIAGGNFAIYFNMVRGKYKSILKNEEFKFYLKLLFTLIIVASVYLYITEFQEIWAALRYGSFQVITIVTTTGYATADYIYWAPFLNLLIFFMMFLGGCGGSTGGSVKQIRILTLFKQSFRELNKLIHPNAVIPIRINGQAVKEHVISSIVGYVVLYILIFIGASLTLSLSGACMVTSFSAVAATLGNVGPGIGDVGPMENYALFPSWAKLLLSFLMMIGRLEIYTVIVLLVPEFRRFKKKQ